MYISTVAISILHPRGANSDKASYDYLLYMVIANETPDSLIIIKNNWAESAGLGDRTSYIILVYDNNRCHYYSYSANG